MEVSWKNIIVVTGPPACDKTMTAQMIAHWLGCSVLYLDSFIDGLQCVDSTILTSKGAKDVISIGVRVLLRQAGHQIPKLDLDGGSIVLEFPYSSPSQLIELLAHDEYVHCTRYHFLIIECKPQSKFRWRMFVDQRDRNRMYNGYRNRRNPPPWFSPKSWIDIEKAVERGDYNLPPSCFSFDSYIVPKPLHLSKLEIDTLSLKILWEVRQKVPESRRHPFYEALEYLLFQRDLNKDGSCSLTMQQWQELKCKIQGRGLVSCVNRNTYHDISKYMPSGLGQEEADVYCGICGDGVASDHPTYCCVSCPVALHKACAELDWKNKKLFKPIESQIILDRKIRATYIHTCDPEERRKYDFENLPDDHYGRCLLDTRDNHKLWPRVIHHPFHQHFLQISANPISHPCSACGTFINDTLSYNCKLCNLQYSYICVDLPFELVSNHIGYKHIMKLKPSSTDEDLDNYMCHICWEERDPQLWCYYCEDCDYAAHIDCALRSLKLQHYNIDKGGYSLRNSVKVFRDYTVSSSDGSIKK